MKCNWSIKKLSEIAYINPKESIGKGIMAKKVPMDKLQPFCRDIPEFILEEYKGGTKFRNGDTIMARITPCLENGKISKVSILDDEEVGFGSTEYIVFRAIEGVSDTDFLYYLICSPLVRNPAIKSMVGSSGRQRVQTDVVADLDIELPNIKEQRKIGSILMALDDKIALNNEINNNLLQQVIALYEHLLQTEEWPSATILDIAKKVAMGPFGSNIKIATFVPEGVPIISGNHLRGFFLEEHEFNYITEEHAELLKNSIVYPHDLIFTHAGNIGQVAMIPDGCKYGRYVLSQRQFYLRCDESKIVPEFLLMFFHSASGQHELLSYANQTGVPSIAQPASNLKKISFKCPSMQKQLKWQEEIRPMLGRYLNNRLENERLSALRDVLLPKLMSGELDISDINI